MNEKLYFMGLCVWILCVCCVKIYLHIYSDCIFVIGDNHSIGLYNYIIRKYYNYHTYDCSQNKIVIFEGQKK